MIKRLFGAPNAEALEVLIRNFDVADVKAADSVAALDYNISKIDIAETAVQKIEDPKERRGYQDWLYFFRSKTEAALDRFKVRRDHIETDEEYNDRQY